MSSCMDHSLVLVRGLAYLNEATSYVVQHHPRWTNLTKHGLLEKEMATHSTILAWRIPWTVWKGEKKRPQMSSSMDINLSKLWETVKDRGAWHATVYGVTESDMTWQLNNKRLYQSIFLFLVPSLISSEYKLFIPNKEKVESSFVKSPTQGWDANISSPPGDRLPELQEYAANRIFIVNVSGNNTEFFKKEKVL